MSTGPTARSVGALSIGPSGAITRPLKTSENVAREIVHSIVEDGLGPGDGLSSENAMIEHFGVSRESVREALRQLEVQGLISIRRGPGGGPVVGTVDPANLGRMQTLYFHLAGATYRELFEAWVFAESTLAELAAKHPDRAERERAMSRYLSSGSSPNSVEELNLYISEHARYHGAVASLARNRVLEISLQTMGQIVSHHMAVEYDPRFLADIVERDHVELARAIVDGQASRARSLMEGHIRSIARVNEEHLGADADAFIEWR